MRTLLPVLLFLCTCFSLQAQLQLTIEEDYFAGPFNSDANYTGGFHVIYKNYYFNYKMTYRSLEYQSQNSAPQDFVPKGHVWAAVTLGKRVGME